MTKLFIFFSTIIFPVFALFQGNGSYNSFRNQVGFCKLQGFNTTSRESSDNDFLVNRHVFMGVGLNKIQFAHNISNCGRCIKIHRIHNFMDWNPSLTEWIDGSYTETPFIVMVMDECNDPVCSDGFLDFDIYNVKQPVKYGNPQNIIWEFIECPNTTLKTKFLFCFSNSCHDHDPLQRTIGEVLAGANPYFWNIYIYNLVKPVYSVYIIEYDIYMELKEGWFWNFGLFDLTKPFTILLSNEETVLIDFMKYKDKMTNDAYRGGFFIG